MIVGREMIDDLSDPGEIKEQKILAKMARMARTVARTARWLADFPDPKVGKLAIFTTNRETCLGCTK